MNTNSETQSPVKPADEREQAAIAWLASECERVAKVTEGYVAITFGVQRTDRGNVYHQASIYGGESIGTFMGESVAEAAELLLCDFSDSGRAEKLRKQAAALMAEADATEARVKGGAK